jgi:hypothetical protein
MIGVDFRVRSQPSFLYLFSSLLLTWECYCMSGIQAGGSGRSGTEGQDEYMGAFVVLSSSRPKGLTLRSFSWYYIFVGHCRPRTFPDHHRIVLPRSAGHYTRYEYSPRHVSPPGSHRGSSLSSLAAHALPHVCNMHLVFDCRIENRSRRSRDG